MAESKNTAQIADQIEELISAWETKLLELPEQVITSRRNGQNRNIKQIIGHLIDSCANNHHRIVRLQYTKRLLFPDYLQDNDTWIAIQNHQLKDWSELVGLWKFYSRHIAFIIRSIQPESLGNLWTDGFIQAVKLEAIVDYFPKHIQLHLDEIQELIN